MRLNVSNKPFQSILIAVTLLLIGGPVMSLEEPEYKVVHEQDGIEYRQYDAYIITQTTIDSTEDYSSASSIGFKRLFRYISGHNTLQADVKMTAPVSQAPVSQTQIPEGSVIDDGAKESQSISMTAPVQRSQSPDGYVMSFVLPKKYTLATAPVPLDPLVRTVEVPAKMVAVVRYSGRWTQNNLEKHQQMLLTGLQQQGVTTEGLINSAYYNAPFSIPAFRRNEVMITVLGLPVMADKDPA